MKPNQNFIKANLLFKILLLSILSVSMLNVQAQRRHHNKQKHAAHHKYSKLPRWGYSYKVAPKNAFVITHSGKRYHYSSGIYYKRVGANYIIAKAPVGIRVRTLPKDRIKCQVKGRKYFYYYGTFYVKADNGDEYLTVDPPVGAQIDALPEGYKTVKVDGEEYYEFEGTYYKPIVNNKDEDLFEVVGIN